jgi:hypothetical protein
MFQNASTKVELGGQSVPSHPCPFLYFALQDFALEDFAMERLLAPARDEDNGG